MYTSPPRPFPVVTMAGPVQFYRVTLCVFALLLLEVKGRHEGLQYVCGQTRAAAVAIMYTCARFKVRWLCAARLRLLTCLANWLYIRKAYFQLNE